MVAYGGDEVNALVLDVGSTTVRAGYAGEDVPRVTIPTRFGYVDTDSLPDHQAGKAVDSDIVMENIEDEQMSEDRQQQEGQQSPCIRPATKKRQYYIGDNKINRFKGNMEIKSPLKDGIVEDWDAMEQIWETIFKDMLRIDPEEHPLLCTEPAWNTKENREKITQLAFEKFQFPAFYLAQDAVMTAFSAGRATALVLDSGGSMTSAVPVYDGFVLNKGILYQPLAGDTLTEQIKKQLKLDLNYDTTAQYKIAKKKPVEADQKPDITLRQFKEDEQPTESFDDYQVQRILNEYKETVGQISDVTFDEGLLSAKPVKSFEFPDGYNHSFGIERYKIPEMLFQPDILDKKEGNEDDEGDVEMKLEDDEQATMTTGTTTVPKKKLLGVHELIYNSINNCDIDLRPLLFNNVVVTGGNTLFNGFNERLNFELPLKAPGSKIKIHASGNTIERKSSSWLGGSILASLGTFHQLWISRKEYDEFGPSIIHRKC
ncbi:actin family [Mycotypha africana]|uniref:actin family n=1 Tax=Mycotypha africana TaxID=64632 RepID=UPI002300AEB8|nr:actin family [Mycotypha africana]KAI8988598.1 actin family [Mycotypha africana]